jgi:hypothetical protein
VHFGIQYIYFLYTVLRICSEYEYPQKSKKYTLVEPEATTTFGVLCPTELVFLNF